MGTLWQDVRYSLRSFRRQPGLAAAILFALALGIGANTVIFSVVNAVLLNPLSFSDWRNPDRVLMLWETNSALSFMWANEMPVRPRNYRAWKEQQHSFSQLAACSDEMLTLTDPHDARPKPEQVETGRATANLFPLLGIQPRIGRGFSNADMQHGNGAVALLSDELYRSRFNSNPKLLAGSTQSSVFCLPVSHFLPSGVARNRKSRGFGCRWISIRRTEISRRAFLFSAG